MIAERILHEVQAPRLRANLEVRLNYSLIVGVCMDGASSGVRQRRPVAG